MNATRTRLAAASGAAYVVLIMTGSAVATAGTDQSTHPTGASVLNDATRLAASSTAHAGLVLELLGFLAFIIFIGYLIAAVSRQHNDLGVAPPVAAIAATVMLAVKLASAAPMGALQLDHQHLSASTAQVLNDMNGYAFIVSWLPAAVFVFAAGITLHKAEIIGRTMTAAGMIVGAISAGLAIDGLTTPAGANPLGFLAGLLWILAVSMRLTIGPIRTTPKPRTAATQAAPALSQSN